MIPFGCLLLKVIKIAWRASKWNRINIALIHRQNDKRRAFQLFHFADLSYLCYGIRVWRCHSRFFPQLFIAFTVAEFCFHDERIRHMWSMSGMLKTPSLIPMHVKEKKKKWFLAWQLRFFLSSIFTLYLVHFHFCYILACIRTFRLFITCNRLKRSWQQLPWKTQVSAWTCLFRYAYLRMCWEKTKWEVHI